ncbi:hypothetical protein ABIC29_002008 [Agromyces sp. PvR057]
MATRWPRGPFRAGRCGVGFRPHSQLQPREHGRDQRIVLLVAGIGICLLAVGPWRALRSPWLWAGVGVVVVALPNLP